MPGFSKQTWWHSAMLGLYGPSHSQAAVLYNSSRNQSLVIFVLSVCIA